MPVRNSEQQDKVLLEAIQNHNPDCVVVDEIGKKSEVSSIASMSQRGVGMVATAHAISLSGLLKNQELIGLVGGVQSTTLGDTLAMKQNNGRKTRRERMGAPIFPVIVELRDGRRWKIHRNASKSVDSLLQREIFDVEERRLFNPQTDRISIENNNQKNTIENPKYLSRIIPYHDIPEDERMRKVWYRDALEMAIGI